MKKMVGYLLASLTLGGIGYVLYSLLFKKNEDEVTTIEF